MPEVQRCRINKIWDQRTTGMSERDESLRGVEGSSLGDW